MKPDTRDADAAATQLATVVEFFRKADATWFLGRLRERARALGVPFPDEPDKSAPSPLTRREREVAALVAEGLTNREIADRLTISVRTAESHVDQIRAKLGFRTRAQIAAWAANSVAGVS